MHPIHALLSLSALGGIAAAATSIVQVKTCAAYLSGSPQPFTFDLFNPALGTLTSVTLGFTFTKSGGSLAVDNDGLTGGNVLFRHDVEGYLQSSDVVVGSSSAANTILARSSAIFFLDADDGDRLAPLPEVFNVGGPDYFLYDAATKTGTYAAEEIPAASWGAYSGNGSCNIDFMTIPAYGTSGLSGLMTDAVYSSVTPIVTLTYNYVPEPAGLLLGSGVVVTVLRRRRVSLGRLGV